MLNPLVTNYVDAAIEQLRRLELIMTPGKLPVEMRDDSIPPSNDWRGWKPVPSTVTNQDLDAMEREIGLKFPPLYRDFLQYKHFVDLTERGVQFERHLSDSWRETLRNAHRQPWLNGTLLDRGFIAFGSETFMDAGPVCFDTNRRDASGDCAVVFLDHEWIDTHKEVNLIFSSSAKMFECLTLVAQNKDFLYHTAGKDDHLLPWKRERLTEFFAIDPQGAGGPAREYWGNWIEQRRQASIVVAVRRWFRDHFKTSRT